MNMQNREKGNSNLDSRDLKIAELEAQVRELKEREKIIQAIKEAQVHIINNSKIRVIQPLLSKS